MRQLRDQRLIVCPRCRSDIGDDVSEWRCTNTKCRYESEPFPVVSGVPALVDFERSVIDADRLNDTDGASQITRPRFSAALSKLVRPNSSVPTSARVGAMLKELRTGVVTMGRRPRILVIGGGAVGNGLSELYEDNAVDLITFDIYASPNVQFIGDGHAMPLAAESVDGVIVQAVLEHVLEPTVVAAEIDRVLRLGGLVYAETPFMQHVHEGPYDFTRFTESGHRYLFRRFEVIDSGAVSGAGTVLSWSIERFVRALTRSTKLGKIAALCFFWLCLLDRFLDPRHSLDAASGVYFLGRKTERPISPREIIAYYQGGM